MVTLPRVATHVQPHVQPLVQRSKKALVVTRLGEVIVLKRLHGCNQRVILESRVILGRVILGRVILRDSRVKTGFRI